MSRPTFTTQRDVILPMSPDEIAGYTFLVFIFIWITIGICNSCLNGIIENIGDEIRRIKDTEKEEDEP